MRQDPTGVRGFAVGAAGSPSQRGAHVLLPEQDVKDPLALVDALGAARVSRIWVVPSLLRAMLDSHPGSQDRLPQLRFWVTAARRSDPELYAVLRAHAHAVLYNLYGTSEAWDVTWFDPGREERPVWRIPIGRPLPNVRTYVLDRRRLPVPWASSASSMSGASDLRAGTSTALS